MATQSAKKKRIGSRRRVPNQNEMSKADESDVTDNTFVAQRHIPEENTESLNVHANPDNSQSETQHSPSPEISGNRRKLGSSRRSKGKRVEDSATESFLERREEVDEKTMVNETTITKQMSLAVQPETEDVLSQGNEQMSPTREGYLYSATTPDYSYKVLNATTINCPEAELESSVPKSEHLQAHLDEKEAESIVVSDSCKLAETMQEGIEKSHTLRSEEVKESAQDGNLQSIYLVSESHVESVLKQFSTTPEITTDEISPIKNTEIKCIDGQATLSSPKEELPTDEEPNEHLNISEVEVAHLSEDDVNTVHEQKIELTEMAQINDSFESMIHDATENSEIPSGNLIDPTKISDTYQSEFIGESTDDSPTSQEISNPDNLQDEHPTKESNFEAIEQKIEDYHVYDTKEPQIGDIEDETELGQIYELEDNKTPNAEQTGHQEKEGLVSEMDESASSLQTQQSELNSPFDSQPQHNDTVFNPIGNRRKLGSSRRNKGRQHVKDTVAESYHNHTEDVVDHIKDNEPLVTTEMSLTTETAVQGKSMETILEGMDKCDTAQTEDVGGTHFGIDLHSTVDQQMLDQPNLRQMPDEEHPSVWSVTEKESHETDDTELFRQNVMSEDIDSSITPEITTELHSSGEHTEIECSVEQTLFLSSKEELPTNDVQNEILNLSEVEGAHQSEYAVNKVHEQEVKPTQMQEMPQIDYSFETMIHDATENCEILSGNMIDPTKISDTYQSEFIGESTDDSPTSQEISNPDNLQDEHPTKESNFEAIEQKIEDYHVYDTKEPQIGDIEDETELGQIYELEDNKTPNAEQTGHQEKEGLVSEMDESASSLQTQQSELNSPFDSQPQHNDTVFNPIGNRRKLGSSRRNKGRQHVKDTVAESYHNHTEDVVDHIKDNEPLVTTEMSLTTETAVQGKSMETILEGMDKCDTAQTEDVGGTHFGIDLHSTVDQQMLDQPNLRQMPDEEHPSVWSVTEKESHETDDTELFRQNVMSEDIDSSITPEITTELHSSGEHTEIECSVEQTLFLSSKEELPTNDVQNEILNLSEVEGAHQSEYAVNKVHEQEVKPTQMQEMPQIDYSFETMIHDATENCEILSGNLIDPTIISDTYQSEFIGESTDDSPTNQEISNPDNLQNEHPTKESNFEAIEQKIEDYHVYDTKEPQIGDIEDETELGQIYELEDNKKPSAEQTGHQEKEGLVYEMEESESSLQTRQSELNSPFDSQPQHNDTVFNPIGNRRKLGSSRRNKGKQHVKDTVAESYHNHTEDVVEHIKDNEPLETTEMSLTTETAVQKKSMETILEGMDKCDTAQTEDVGGTHFGIDLHSSSTVDQQMLDQSNLRQMPDEEHPSVWSVTEKESHETDNDTELFRQNVMSEDIDPSITPEITTELHSSGEHTEIECSVEQTLFLSSKEELPTNDRQNEIFNLSEVEGAHQSEHAVNKVHEQEVKPTQMQEMPQIDYSFETMIHDATENSEILSGNLIDPTKISDTYQSEFIGESTNDSPTNQEISNPDNLHDEHPSKESNFEAIGQKIEDYHVDDTKEPQIGDIEDDTELGQIYELEDNKKPSAEQTGHQEKEGLVSEMDESASSLQTRQSELHSPFDSQPEHDTVFNPIGNRRKLGSSRRNKGRQHVKDTVAESYHNHTEDVVDHIKDNEPLKTTEMSLTTETAVQEKSMETILEGMDKCDTAQTEDVGGTHFGIDLHSSSTVDQQMLDQPNIRQMPDEERPSVWFVTEKESHETDNDTELFRQNVMSEDIDSSITPEITTELHSSGEHTEIECSVEQTLFLSSKEELPTSDRQNEIFNLYEVEGAHQSEHAVNKVQEQEVKSTQMQEMPQIDYSFETMIHDATENSEILSGNMIDPTKISDTYQSEFIGESTDDSSTNQENSNPDNLQNEHPTKESNFEAIEQKIEDYHVYDTKEPQTGDIEDDTELGQIYELEDNKKPSAEQTGHQEKEGLVSEMDESASSLQTRQSKLNSPFDSQPQHNDTVFNPIGNRRILGSSRRNKGRQHVKDTVAESYHNHTEDVVEHIKDNEPLETTEMSLTTETAVQKKSMETMFEGMDKCDTAQTEDVGGTHFGIGLHSSSTVDQQMLDQPNLRQMPDEERPSVWSVTEKESNETDNDTELFRQNVMSEDIDPSITPEITTELHSSGEQTEIECSVENTLFLSSKAELATNDAQNEIFDLSEVKVAHQSEHAVNKVHEQEVKSTQMQEMPQIDYSFETMIHDATENSEILSGNLIDPTKISDTYQSEFIGESTDDSSTNQENSNPDNLQNEHPTKESNFEAIEQKIEDYHVYDTKEPQTGDIEDDTELGQIYELEDNKKPSAEQTGHQEKEGLVSEMDESASSLQTRQSKLNSPFDSQPQHNDTVFNPIGNRRKLGSSRRNKGRQHVKDTVAESYHNHTEDVVEHIKDNEPLETTEMSLTTETAVQKKSMETMFEGMDKCDTAQTEDVGGTHFGIGLHSSSTVDQQMLDQPNLRQMPDEERPSVWSVTEKESNETDNDTELFRQNVMSEDIDPSITPEITTELHSTGEHTEMDVSEECEISSKQGIQEKTKLDDSETLQITPKQRRRKMGSTRQTPFNRRPEEKRSETKDSDCNTEADMINLDKMGAGELPVIATTDVSLNPKSSLSLFNKEQQETNETSTIHNNGQKLQSSALQIIPSDMISDTDYSKVLLPEQSVSHNEEVVNPVEFVQIPDVKDSGSRVDISVEPSQIDDFTATEMHLTSALAGRNSVNQLWSASTDDTANTGITEGSFVSLCETTQSTQNECVNVIQDQALKSAEAPVVTDVEIVKSVVRGGAGEEDMSAQANKQEPHNVNEGAQNEILEMKNASPKLDSTNRRRKMGSTRRNLGSRTKREDLHQKQEVDNDATEAATNVGDVKTERFSGIIEDELKLHIKDSGAEQRKEKVFETVEYSHTGESYLKPHQTFEENPVSRGQLVETEHQLTPNYPPEIPSTSPKHDSTLESASSGRRRKMGSHRKSHGHQINENQTARGDRITDTQNVRDVRSITEESAIKTTEELEEESLGLDKISEVDTSDKKPSSDISTSKEGEQPVSENTPDPATPVRHPYAEIRLGQGSQQTFSLEGHSRGADLRSNAYNVMMVGDSSVGKTSFMKRAQSGKFSLDLPASVGLDSCMWPVVVDGKPLVLQLWDTAGQERFHSITRQIFYKAHAFLLMYDITSSQSFSAVSYWASCIQEGAAENVTVLLVGNKSDCAERQVKTQEAEILAKEHNFGFTECSAATGENVVQSLETVARMLSHKVDTREEALVLHKEPQQKKSAGCC